MTLSPIPPSSSSPTPAPIVKEAALKTNDMAEKVQSSSNLALGAQASVVISPISVSKNAIKNGGTAATLHAAEFFEKSVADQIAPSVRAQLDEQRMKLLKPFLSTNQSRNLIALLHDPAQIEKLKVEMGLEGRIVTSLPSIPPGAEVGVTFMEGKLYICLPAQLGSGALNTVYKAIHFEKAENVAHVILQELQPKEVVEREARILKLFKGKEGHGEVGIVHTHSVSIIAVPNEPLLRDKGMMQAYYGDGDLQHVLTAGQQINATSISSEESFQKKVDQAIQLLQGLTTIHTTGVVHNDIKPANILLGNGNAVIADFGEARLLNEPFKFSMGTPIYAPPEVFECFRILSQEALIADQKSKLTPDDKEYKELTEQEAALQVRKEVLIKALGSPRDVWAMGLVLYELFFPREEGFPWKENPFSINRLLAEFGEKLDSLGVTPAEKQIARTIRQMLGLDERVKAYNNDQNVFVEGLPASQALVAFKALAKKSTEF